MHAHIGSPNDAVPFEIPQQCQLAAALAHARALDKATLCADRGAWSHRSGARYCPVAGTRARGRVQHARDGAVDAGLLARNAGPGPLYLYIYRYIYSYVRVRIPSGPSSSSVKPNTAIDQLQVQRHHKSTPGPFTAHVHASTIFCVAATCIQLSS